MYSQIERSRTYNATKEHIHNLESLKQDLKANLDEDNGGRILENLLSATKIVETFSPRVDVSLQDESKRADEMITSLTNKLRAELTNQLPAFLLDVCCECERICHERPFANEQDKYRYIAFILNCDLLWSAEWLKEYFDVEVAVKFFQANRDVSEPIPNPIPEFLKNVATVRHATEKLLQVR